MKLKEAREAAREFWQAPEKYEARAKVGSFKDVAQESSRWKRSSDRWNDDRPC